MTRSSREPDRIICIKKISQPIIQPSTIPDKKIMQHRSFLTFDKL